MLSDSIVRTYTDALLAADAGIRIFDVNVLVYLFSTDSPSKAVSNLLFLSKINLLDCINVSVSIQKNQIPF
jgi:hypothetical protein